MLKLLKKAAESDLYRDMVEQIEGLEANLKDDQQTNLQTYKKEIIETINSDIILRHAYQAGVIEHNVADDPEVERGAELLENPAEYRRLLSATESETATE